MCVKTNTTSTGNERGAQITRHGWGSLVTDRKAKLNTRKGMSTQVVSFLYIKGREGAGVGEIISSGAAVSSTYLPRLFR
jgi:hypothetical protein